MASPCSPSCCAIWLHTAGSYPSVVSISRRTSAEGDLSSRKRRTERRSSSCSSVKAKFTAATPPWTASDGRTDTVVLDQCCTRPGGQDAPRGHPALPGHPGRDPSPGGRPDGQQRV